MNDKKIKEAMKQYIETQADNISSESEEKHDLTSLDEKVYAMLGTNQNKHKTAAVWSFREPLNNSPPNLLNIQSCIK